ncbi:NACHT domain-containing protein [Stigmatella sp. ncwal1]|uniref:NACHT domain-containing protein n=1 Tax=Stigmatella ashevillensis TaxID=2995309 RepID=A0ABT5DL03_9BACT|nr:NACHT domain-containing protein [Stigmatella ashevillena]MDC0714345.1 NACHT domain-containing protein [Stigmatella ashevillena]
MSDSFKKVLFAVGAQLPVVGALWGFWSSVKQHPGGALLIAGAWELAVLAGAFINDVWTELRKDALKATVDWVRAAVRGFSPGFRRHYNRWLILEYSIFNVRGLGLIATFTLLLDKVFVELRISPANPQKLNLDPFKETRLKGNRLIWDLLRAAIANSAEAPAVLAILGPPGCGKTTLLQHVAVTLAANRQRRFRLRAYTPVLLLLRDHIAAITKGSPPSLGEVAFSHFSNIKIVGKTPPEGWFEKQLRAGRCIVLLDGLDEVAKVEQRQAISKWVDAQIGNYPKCPFVITSRPQGYKSAPLGKADILEVQPFGVTQVRQFIERWYLANEIKSSGNQINADVRHRASKHALDLIERLRQTPSVNALTVNPLLLAMVAMVHRYHGALPGSRVELYKEICEVLLGRWRQAKGLQDDLTAARKLRVLQPLAAYMMEKERRDIGVDEAIQVISAPLERVGLTEGEHAEFLGRLRDSSGLVQEREAGKWSFAHQTFQEYLAAAHWLEQKNARSEWKRLVVGSWWRETLRLYASQGDATELVQACLEVGSVDALTLAADCLDEAREIAPAVRRAAEEQIIAGLEAENPTHRRLAAEVQLTRRLRSLQAIDDKRSIDLKHLTCAEYQLFLDDMHAQREYRQPDHWLGLRFAKAQGHDALCGVRAEDAVMFCNWLTLRGGGRVRYRLPHSDEVRTHPSEDRGLGTWCRDNGKLVLECSDEAHRTDVAKVLAWQSLTKAFSALAERLTFNIARALNRDLTRDLTRALVRDLDFALARDLTSASARDLDRSRALALGIARDIARDLDFALAHGLDRALALAFDRVRKAPSSGSVKTQPQLELNANYQALIFRSHERLPNAVKAIKDANAAASIFGLMNALITVAGSQSLMEMRSAQRAFLIQLLKEYTVNISSEPPPLSLLQRAIKRISSIGFQKEEIMQSKMDLLAFTEGVRFIAARETGQLSAWEGIRLVRETLPEQDEKTTDPGRDEALDSFAA